jgi:hypothetical protein
VNLILAAVLVLGAKKAPVPLLITWPSNGNPGVPLCSTTVKKSCVSGFTVKGGGYGHVVLPATASSYLAPNAAKTYYVRTNGYDYKGNAISSAYETVPVK